MKSPKKTLADDHLSLLDVGECWLHKVYNAFSHGLDSFAVEVESAHYFFKHSSVQSSHLKEQQNVLGLPETVFLRHVSSPWLSLMPALEQVLEQLPALESVLAAKAPVRSNGIKECSSKSINNKEFHAKAFFADNAAEMFAKFLTLFQKSEPLLHILHSECVPLLKNSLGKVPEVGCLSKHVRASTGHAQHRICSELEGKRRAWHRHRGSRGVMRSTRKSNIQAWGTMKCARYLQKQLRLKNSVLTHLSCLEPHASVSEYLRVIQAAC